MARKPFDGTEEVPVVAREELLAAIDALPESYAEVIRRRYFGGQSTASIAEELEIPVNTVRSRIQRGLGRLSDSLGRRWRRSRSAFAWIPFPWSAADPLRSVGLVAWGLLAAIGIAAVLLLGPSDGEGEVDLGQVEALVPAALPGAAGGEVVEGSPGSRTLLDPVRAAAGELVVRGLWADGPPAAGLGYWLEGEREGASRRAVSDGEGMVRWRDLEPGNYELSSTAYRLESRGDVQVEARDALEVRMAPSIGRGLALRFGQPRPLTARVEAGPGVDLRDRPVHLSLPGFRERLILMGHTDASGRLALRHFEPESWIMANRNGRGMSMLFSLTDPRLRSESRPTVRLEPMERANELHPGRSWVPLALTVLSSEGELVFGAVAELHPIDPAPVRRMDGTLGCVPVVRGVTDSDGTCLLHFNGPGPVELRVSHAGHPEWRRRVGTLRSEEVVRLVAGSRLVGGVLDLAGRPVAGARVGWRGRGTSGQARTDEGGRFFSASLSPGAYELWAQAGEGEHVYIARRRVELEVDREESLELDLEPARWLRGRALDSLGQPMVDHWVALLADRPADPAATRVPEGTTVRWAKVDDAGEFGFAEDADSLDRETVYLALFRRRKIAGVALDFLEVPGPEAEGILLGPRRVGTADGGLRIGLEGDADGADLLLSAAHNPVAVQGRREGRRWSFDGLSAGRWSVLHWGPGSLTREVARVELRVGERIELDVPSPPPFGGLDLTLKDSGGLPVVPRQVDLMSVGNPSFCVQASLAGPSEWLSIEGQGRVRGRVPPGEYLLIVRGERTTHESARLRLVPGEVLRTEVLVQARDGRARQAVQFELPSGAVGRATTVWLEFRTPEGDTVLEDVWTRHPPNMRRFTAYPRLPLRDLVARARVHTSHAAFESAPHPLAADRDRKQPLELRFERTGREVFDR